MGIGKYLVISIAIGEKTGYEKQEHFSGLINNVIINKCFNAASASWYDNLPQCLVQLGDGNT